MNNNNYERVLSKLFDNPTTVYHIRGIARELKLNPNTILNVIAEIKNQDLIIIDKKRHILEFKANFESLEFIRKKRLYNIAKLYGSGIIEAITKKINLELISVIGSYSRGEDIEKSDVDLVVISDKKNEEIKLENYEKDLKRKIHMLILSYEEMSDEFYNNLINGVVLYGYLKRK